MFKRLALSALLASASSLAFAQTQAPSAQAASEQSQSTQGPSAQASPQSQDRPSASDLAALTDARVNIVRGALQLTPDQEKYWPAIEDAIRTRGAHRQARLAAVAQQVSEMRNRSPIDALRDRDPIAFLQRRADALSQRADDLRKLATAWQPLYQTLSPDQKRRMAALAILVVRELRNGAEQRRIQSADDYEN